MSVINKMLRDLEQRQATSNADTTSRRTSINPQQRYPLWLWLVPLLIIGLIAIYQWQQNQKQAAEQLHAVEAAAHAEPDAEQVQPDVAQVAVEQAASQQVAVPANSVQEIATPEPMATPNSTIAAQPIVAQADELPNVQHKTAGLTQDVSQTDTRAVSLSGGEGTTLTSRTAPQELKNATDKADNVNQVAEKSQQEQAQQSAVVAPAVSQLSIERAEVPLEQQAARLQQQAVAAQHAGNAERAAGYWQQLIALTPDIAQPYVALAGLWLQYGQPQAAQQVLQQAVQHGIVNADIQLMLAQLAAQQQAWQQVMHHLSHDFNLALQPDYYGLKATALQQLGQHQQALQWFSQLTQLQPQQGRWWLGGAISFEALQQPAQAHQFYRQALQWGGTLSPASRDYIQQRLIATE